MVRVQAGDTSAFEELVAHYWAPLVRYARRLLGDLDDAQDAVQEAFARLWARRTEWRPTLTGTVQAYLYRLGRSVAIDELRRRQTRRLWIARASTLPAMPPATPIQLFERARLAEALEKAIQSLPERRREVFILAAQHDLSHAEIGDILGTSIKTVANQMWAAVAELRKRLREQEYEP
jgi:RNA polymerase sigma-70 factor (ECF subfamily)